MFPSPQQVDEALHTAPASLEQMIILEGLAGETTENTRGEVLRPYVVKCAETGAGMQITEVEYDDDPDYTEIAIALYRDDVDETDFIMTFSPNGATSYMFPLDSGILASLQIARELIDTISDNKPEAEYVLYCIHHLLRFLQDNPNANMHDDSLPGHLKTNFAQTDILVNRLIREQTSGIVVEKDFVQEFAEDRTITVTNRLYIDDIPDKPSAEIEDPVVDIHLTAFGLCYHYTASRYGARSLKVTNHTKNNRSSDGDVLTKTAAQLNAEIEEALAYEESLEPDPYSQDPAVIALIEELEYDLKPLETDVQLLIEALQDAMQVKALSTED